MRQFLIFTTKLSVLSTLALLPIVLSGGSASAQPKTGTNATYVGAGISAGVTNGGQNADAATFGGTIQGRLPVGTSQFSVRGAVHFTDATSTVMPIVTYDVPISNKANAYVGGGYGFHQAADGTQPTSFGNKDAPVVAVGVESQVGENVIVFSDAKVGIKPYQNSNASSVSLQVGAGYRF